MPFPNTQRVIYDKNPLDKVICQLRFAPILKINAEIPATYQDKIRSHYPSYSESNRVIVEAPEGQKGAIPPEVLSMIMQNAQTNKNYQFSSEDNNWKVNLTYNFISLAASDYKKWEDFKERLNIPLNALNEVYSPQYFLRVGLRYVDIISRKTLGLEGVHWEHLLKPHILGILGSSDVSESVQEFENRYRIGLDDGESQARIIMKFVKRIDDEEICFMIDTDFSNMTKTDSHSATTKLDYLNRQASRFIQWCITDRLHSAMGPREITP